jgi:Protein of unknown function (DUF4238)
LIKKITRSLFSDVEEVKARLRADGIASEEVIDTEAQAMVQMAGGAFTVSTKQRWAVGLAIKSAFEIAPLLAGRHWTVLHRSSDKKSFVTTDAAVLLTTVVPREDSSWGVGFGNSDALVFFPLNQSCVLAMLGDAGGLNHAVATAEQIRQVNLGLAAGCQRFVIGRDESLIRSLTQQLGLADRKWHPSMNG